MNERVISAADGVRVRAGGRTLLSFAGCDTLGLARRPEVIAAASHALDRCGVGSSASRTTTGTWSHHVRLESELADWIGTGDAVVLPAGWLASGVLAAALAARCDHVRLDAAAHPALVEAAERTGKPVGADGAGRALVLAQAVDLVEGRVAALAALHEAATATGGVLVVDDAHGVGVLGDGGRGTASRCGLPAESLHLAGSLSKALGCHGGFVAAPRNVCETIRNEVAAYAGATPTPPAIAAAARAAVALARDGDALRARLAGNVGLLRARFEALGLEPPAEDVPWFCIRGRPATELDAIADGLREAGFLAPRSDYFGAPGGGILRIALSAAHSTDDVAALGRALTNCV